MTNAISDLVTKQHLIERAAALRLPPLDGLRVLDACADNGVLCCYALFEGARKVVGVVETGNDIRMSAAVVAPGARFVDALPKDELFDVVMLTEEYASDVWAERLTSLMSLVAPEGVLVLEIGMVSSRQGDKIVAETASGKRVFPSMAWMTSRLAPYAYKHLGHSVRRETDVLSRHVFHVRHRRPFAYLLMSPPAHGKSTISRLLFAPAGVRIVSGDQTMVDIANGRMAVPPSLHDLIGADFSPSTIDRTTQRIFQSEHWRQWIDALLVRADGGDFALDSYVPTNAWSDVCAFVEQRGYVAVRLEWNLAAPLPISHVAARGRAQSFAQANGVEITDQAAFAVEENSAEPAPEEGVIGYVESIRFDGSRVRITGWAVGPSHRPVSQIMLRVGDRELPVASFAVRDRPDVRRHFGVGEGAFGYDFTIDGPFGDEGSFDVSALTVLAAATPGSACSILAWSSRLLDEFRKEVSKTSGFK